MDVARFQRLRAVYERASELPRGERTPYLEAACEGDLDLRRETERMLAAGAAPGFLARPDEAPPEPPPLPDRVGPYRVRALLGEGGFGVVYRAEQREPVEREVALKVLHRRAGARSASRFEAECRTLARLQHASVAQLLDAGRTEDGQLFLAMELVEGLPITAYADRRRLSIDARLLLFQRVASAIEHAHQRGVVHRDLKPSNVLVKDEGGEALPKVIDFGVAKLVLDAPGAAAEITREGQPLGTPGYMSPEQAAGLAVDTRTDVYALGVMLFDLLAGDLPFARRRLSTRSPGEVLRIVRDEEPRRMSAALADTGDPDAVAAQRDCDRAALQRTLRGDLEWIVRKALAKAPDARYASVTALTADVERFRRREPVSAREHRAFYLLRSFVARHRLGVALATAAAAVLVIGVAGLLWALREVSDARDLALARGAEADRQRDRAVLGEYAAQLAAARSALAIGDATGARRYLAEAAEVHRGWEWRHLAASCDRSTAAFPIETPVYAVAWLDDRRCILRTHRAARILAVDDGRTLARFGPFEPELDGLLVDTRGQRMILDTRTRLSLWDLTTGERTRVIAELDASSSPLPAESNLGDVRGMALAPDGRTLYTSDNRGALSAFDVEGKAPPRVLAELATFGWDIAVLREGAWLAVGLDDGRIELREAATGAAVREPLGSAGEAVKALAVSPDGETLYAASGNTVQAYRLPDGALTARRAAHVELVELALSADGALLYGSGGWIEGELTAWDARTLELVSRFHGHRGGIGAVAPAPEGGRVASGGNDGTARLWPPVAPPSCVHLDAGRDARDFGVSPDGAALAAADMDGRVTVWDARTLEQTLRVELGEELHGCALGIKTVYVGGARLLAVDRETGAVRAGEAATARTGQLCLDDEERWLIGASPATARLFVWSLPGLSLEHVIDAEVTGRFAFDATRGRFLGGLQDGTLVAVDPAAGALTELEAVEGRAWGVSAAHGRVAVAAERPWLLAPDGAERESWGHAQSVVSLALAPDGSRLATGGSDTLLRVFDMQGTELLVLDDTHKPIVKLAFADGGDTLLGLCHQPGSPTTVAAWRAPAEVTLER